MAAEITISLLREKLENLRDTTKIGNPSLLKQVNESIAKLKESLTTLKALEDDKGSHLTNGNGKIELLRAVYDAEDTIDTFLASTISQKQKSFPSIHLKSEYSQSRVSRKMGNFVEHLTTFINNKSVHVEPMVSPSNLLSEDMKVGDAEVHPQNSPTNVEDMQVPPLESKNFGEGTSGSKFSYEDIQVQGKHFVDGNAGADVGAGLESSFSDEDDTSDLEDTAKKLAELILHDDLPILLLSAAGRPGGSHNTTLLWRTYCTIKEHFECCAWTYVSDVYEAIKCVMEQLTGMKQENDLPPTVLQRKLCRFLSNKKYLLVFYDLRTPKVWESLSSALPNLDGGRMIVSFHGAAAAPSIPNARFLGTIFGTELVSPSALNKDVCTSLDEETDIVGLKDEIQKLHKLICRRYQLHFIILVVGVAGSGKTTLILKQVTEVKDEAKLSLEELRKRLRYLFVGKSSAFAVEQTWFVSSYQSNPDGLKGKKHVPAALEWGEAIGTCVEPYNSGTIFCNEDNYCLIQLTSGHVCLCADRRSETSLGCRGTLYCNMTSGQDCSKCPPGYEYDHQNVVTTHGNMVVVQVHRKKKRNEAEAEIL
ncbi:hypothetical protein Patl1_24555 [Pistacia atlantica]|uniref:Uncharacterized protein n=1 Tax=Pistacia atlantica TaxID=434234 RepID=A0ACC1A2N2_9ROSI|nr:hypothetical protein Patl1_24555 [Pistacia atlantica]